MRTRSASPKSVSFSPVLERKYSADRGPLNPPELRSTEWRKYFTDFSAYLGECNNDVEVNRGRESVGIIIERPCAKSVTC